jgi:RecB family endonuclease NucS
MAISEDRKSEIISLLQEGQLGREEIASRVGVSPATVSAVKAHITMGTYRGAGATEAETEELIEASEATFGLERDLQLALRSNIEQLEPGLAIIDDGKERTTNAGRIDITARDKGGTTVVIELKAGTAAPEALTQLLAYMGVIGKEDQKSVRGILVAGDFHPRLVFAAQAVPNVQLRRYHFKFTFDTVE